MLTLSYYVHSMKWVVPAGCMLGSAPTYYALWGSWRIVSVVFPGRVYEAGDEFLYSLYQKLILFFFEKCSGVKIVFYGDVDKLLEKKENVILMSNHQCTVDWLVADMLAVRQGTLGWIRYILKDGLKFLPLYGFYFRQHSCVYVKRSGKFSEQKLIKHLNLFSQNRTPFWMVVFPEGTRYNPNLPEVITKSREYARNHDLPLFEHLLTPRLRALQMCVNHLRPTTNAVYDVTVAYSNTLLTVDGKRRSAPSLADYLQGECSEVHIHLSRVPIENVPDDKKEFEGWLMNRFSLKDKLIEKFYSSEDPGRFDNEGRMISLPILFCLPSVILFGGLNALWFTAGGPSAYWKLSLFGILSGWAWMSIRS